MSRIYYVKKKKKEDLELYHFLNFNKKYRELIYIFIFAKRNFRRIQMKLIGVVSRKRSRTIQELGNR